MKKSMVLAMFVATVLSLGPDQAWAHHRPDHSQGPKPAVSDVDGDGIADESDNCQDVYNPDQSDSDANGVGDACDAAPPPPDPGADHDGDGVADTSDNCPSTFNPDQTDSDGDGSGDLCDLSVWSVVFCNPVTYGRHCG